jgi:hypothetical protein
MGDMWDLRSPVLCVTLLVVYRTDDDRGTLYASTMHARRIGPCGLSMVRDGHSAVSGHRSMAWHGCRQEAGDHPR